MFGFFQAARAVYSVFFFFWWSGLHAHFTAWFLGFWAARAVYCITFGGSEQREHFTAAFLRFWAARTVYCSIFGDFGLRP